MVSQFTPSHFHHHVRVNAQCGSVLILEMALYCGHVVLNEPAQQKCLHSEANAHKESRFLHAHLQFHFLKVLKMISAQIT